MGVEGAYDRISGPGIFIDGECSMCTCWGVKQFPEIISFIKQSKFIILDTQEFMEWLRGMEIRISHFAFINNF